MFNNKNKVRTEYCFTPSSRLCNLNNKLVDTPPLSSPLGEEEQLQKKYSCGFTLAEVLITLVIIGVIAALTLPSLINKTNNQETVSKLKKLIQLLHRLQI